MRRVFPLLLLRIVLFLWQITVRGAPIHAAEFVAKYGDDLDLAASVARFYNHTDEYRDVFSVDMSQRMFKQVLSMRGKIRSQNNQLQELRGKKVIKNDFILRECRKKDIPGPMGKDIVPWHYKHQVVGEVYTDGLGHSLSTYIRQLYIAQMYGCRSTMPNR